MTAHWESVLTQISEKQCRYQDFMQPLVGTLYELINQARNTPVKQFRGWLHRVVRRRNRSKRKKRSLMCFFGCRPLPTGKGDSVLR